VGPTPRTSGRPPSASPTTAPTAATSSATADGAIYAYGSADYVGGANNLRLGGPIVAVSASAPKADAAILQFLQLSDFHGQVDPSGSTGGAGLLSTYWKTERAAIPATFTVNSGDNYGAAPAISSFFNEIPTIRAMNILGFDVNGFGNHEFDKSLTDLRAQLAESTAPWVLANHTNVAANIGGSGPGNATPIQPYVILEKSGIKVAFIGINTPETASLVSPGSLGTMTITDPAAAVNLNAAAARAAGADVVVVLAHMGTNAANLGATGSLPATPAGPLPDLARASTGVDLFYGGHTHLDFQATINGALVQQTTNASGRYTRTRMCVDKTTKAVTGVAGQSVVPSATGVTADPAVAAVLAPFRTQLQGILDPVIATGTALFQRGNTVTVPNPAGGTATPAIERAQETPIGNLVADAIRWKYPEVDVALMNGGGLRSPLPSSYAPANRSLRRTAAPYVVGPPFDIVLGDIFTLLPFGNIVVTKDVTGAVLWDALENGVSRWPASDGRFPQVSGIEFTFDATRPPGAASRRSRSPTARRSPTTPRRPTRSARTTS
jgi:5'-nucleotidase